MCYATLALVTDYDCWREASGDVSVEVILAILRDNAAAARRSLAAAVRLLRPGRACGCREAMRSAILTDRETIPQTVRKRLAPIAGRYL